MSASRHERTSPLTPLGAVIDWRSWAVLHRQVRVYLRNWYTAFLPPALEPILYLLAFGLGLGGYVGSITWHGTSYPYIAYIAPGIVTYTAFNGPFFQGLYGAFIRMHFQKTWEGQLGTQVELRHVVAGEMLWAALQGTVYAGIVCVVLLLISACGFLHLTWWALPLILPLAFVLGCAVALLGLFFTAIVPSIDHMNLPTFLVGFPVGVLSDTYFPVHVHNRVLEAVLFLNPVRHCAEAIRGLLLQGRLDMHAVWLAVISLVIVLIMFPIVVRLMQRSILGE